MYITKEKNYYIINCQFFRNLFINSLLFQAWKDKQTNPMMFSDIPRLCELWLLFSLMPIWKKERKKKKNLCHFYKVRLTMTWTAVLFLQTYIVKALRSLWIMVRDIHITDRSISGGVLDPLNALLGLKKLAIRGSLR